MAKKNSELKEPFAVGLLAFGALCLIALLGILSYQWFRMAKFEYTFYREVDDFALQLGLQKMAESLRSGDLRPWFSTFSYAYGNLFWFINAVFASPFYWVDSEVGALVVPRLLSTLCIFTACGLISRLVFRYTQSLVSGMLCWVSLFMVPAVAEWSQRLHVNSLHVLAGVLALTAAVDYFETQESKKYWWSIGLLGIATGLKLTGLFWVGPTMAILLWRNLDSLYSKKGGQLLGWAKAFALVVQSALLFLGVFIVTANPATLVSFQELRNTFDTATYFIRYKGVNIGSVENLKFEIVFQQGFLGAFWHWLFLGFLAISALIYLRSKIRGLRHELPVVLVFGTLVWGTFIAAYLLLTLKKGPLYMNGYYYTIYPLLGLLWIAVKLDNSWQKGLAFAFVIASFGLNYPNWEKSWFKFSDMENSTEFAAQQRMADAVKPVMAKVLRDRHELRVIVPPRSTTPLSQNITGVSILCSAAFDLLRGGNCENTSADFVIFRDLDIPDELYIMNFSPREMAVKSQEDTKAFLKSGLCGGVHFSEIYYQDGIHVFEKDKI